jgi:hypothetical protein
MAALEFQGFKSSYPYSCYMIEFVYIAHAQNCSEQSSISSKTTGYQHLALQTARHLVLIKVVGTAVLSLNQNIPWRYLFEPAASSSYR